MIFAKIRGGQVRRLDYLKKDVAGYEKYVISEIKDFLGKTLPCIQVEISGDSKNKVEEALFSLGYETYYYNEEKLSKTPVTNYAQDYFYIHPSKVEKYKAVIA